MLSLESYNLSRSCFGLSSQLCTTTLAVWLFYGGHPDPGIRTG